MKRSIKRQKMSVNGLSPIEVDIMQIVWRDSKVTVREVHEELLSKGYVPYTTVMAAMNNLAVKGVLRQNKHSKAYVYSPQLSSVEVANQIIDNVVERLLDGSPKPVLRHLLKIKDTAEIEKLEQLKGKLYE